METKENRLLRQKKSYRKLIREMKKSVSNSYKNDALHNAYYQKIDFIEEVKIIN